MKILNCFYSAYRNILRERNMKKFGKIGKNVVFPYNMKNISRPYNIFLEDYVSIGAEVVLYATNQSKIIVKKGSIIGPRCKLITSNHNFDSKDLRAIPFDNRNNVDSIILQEGVWVGDSVIILSGVNIGKGAVIGSGSIVTKDIPNYAVVAGNPAKVIKYRDKKVFDSLMEQECFYRAKNWDSFGGKEFINK